MYGGFFSDKKVQQEKSSLVNRSYFDRKVEKLCEQCQCYIVTSERAYGRNVEIETFLDGGFDQRVKSKLSFETNCFIYPTLALALKNSTPRGTSNRQSVYIMAMGYSKKKVKQLTAAGNFHFAIVKTINAKDLYRETLGNLNKLTTNELSKIEVCENSNFNAHLLKNFKLSTTPISSNAIL
jgi:hypothetical protein